MDAGNDEILEIVKEKGSKDSIYYPSRILIKFRDDDIKTTISDIVGHSKFNDGTSSLTLKLFATEHKNLSANETIETFAVSQSWNEGTGRFSNLPTSSDGTSWVYRDNDTTKTKWTTSSFTSGTSGSINASGITEGGGTWYTGSLAKGSQSFSKNQTLDTDIDVTSIVTLFSASLFANGIVENQGFIVKQLDSVETNTSNSFGELKYFSSDTHTIYPPKLCFKWDDSQHNNQSSAKQSGELSVSLYRNKEEYNQNEIAKFRVHVRDKYPTRQFVSSSNYLNVGYFTTSSYYSIRDAHTEEEIIPFDDTFTKMSSDAEGMHFNIYMKSLQPERYYRLLFKHTNHDGTIIYDEKHHFKVIR